MVYFSRANQICITMRKLILFIFLMLTVHLYSQEFPIATGSYSQSYPSAVFANGTYYDAFLDKSSGSYNYGFHGKFIDPDGTVQPQDIEIVQPISYLSFMHEIIRGATNYLFVWSRGVSVYDRDAYGVLVGDDGSPSGSVFPVSIGNSESASFVEAAFDGENFLVIWQEGLPTTGSVIRAQFVSQTGQLVGNNFSIRPDGLGSDVAQIYPDVEFNGENFLVVWDDDRNGNRDIYGQFVSVTGELVGEDFAITTNSSDQLLVQLAFGGQNFYAVWGDDRLSSNDRSVFGQLIGVDGALIGENMVVSAQANSEARSWPDVAASNGEYLVAWDQEWLEYKEGFDSRDFTEAVKYQAAGVEMPKPIVWYDVYARKISFQGEYASDEMPICTADYHQQDCDVISDGTNFLVSWSDSRNNNAYYDIYGYIVEGSELPQLPVIEPGEISFTRLQQFLDGGEEFTITNPNDFDITIDNILFNAPELRLWYIADNVSFPFMIYAESAITLKVNLDLPVTKQGVREMETDTMVVQSMNADQYVMLNVDEALLDTIYTYKLDYTVDSLYFQTVDQALNGITFGMINRHWPGIYIFGPEFTGPFASWEIETEWPLPFTIFFKDTLDVKVFASVPTFPEMSPGEIAVDTLTFSSWSDMEFSIPIYYETAVIDSIWTTIHSPESGGGISVYPNPADHEVLVNVTGNEDPLNVGLLDMNGRIIIQGLTPAGRGQAVKINVENLPGGIYLLKTYTSKNIYTQKLVIRH